MDAADRPERDHGGMRCAARLPLSAARSRHQVHSVLPSDYRVRPGRAARIATPQPGYVATAPELRQPVVALSLGGVRRRVEALLVPDDVIVWLRLDVRARRERDRRPGTAVAGLLSVDTR